MQIHTTRFGAIEIKESDLIHFPWGLPGFEELKRFVLLEYRGGPFQWLQSTEEPTVAFVVCPPQVLGIEYRIPAVKLEPIRLDRGEDILILNIVSFNRQQNSIQFHLRSPLLFNAVSRVGYQWTMDSEEVDRNLVIPEGLSGSSGSLLKK